MLDVILKAVMKGPPKVWNPTKVSFGWIKKFNEIWSKEGWEMAYNKVRMESQLREQEGHLVGTDYNGNRYYRTRTHPQEPPGGWPSRPLVAHGPSMTSMTAA